MARLIVKSPYFKGGSTKPAGGYLRYIATRERVEILPDDRPPTKRQTQLIEKLTKNFPDMVKPIDLDELFLRIGALLRRAKIASSRKLEIGSFVMDADEHTAYLGDDEISLTSREFNILYKLLSYPKKTFTRTQLMDEFWDVDTGTAPRAVDVYMTKLRQKLSDCEDFEIKTVHGLGYKAVIK